MADVRRYGIYKKLLEQQAYCSRAVTCGNQDKYRINMVPASDFERTEAERDALRKLVHRAVIMLKVEITRHNEFPDPEGQSIVDDATITEEVPHVD